jgi:hypothetical protein
VEAQQQSEEKREKLNENESKCEGNGNEIKW